MWLKTLRLILQEILQWKGDLPQRISERIDRAIGECQRVILRSGDNETQREECVKKRHCGKNVLISDDDQKIIYLSLSYSGSAHDKTIADEQNFQFHRTIVYFKTAVFKASNSKTPRSSSRFPGLAQGVNKEILFGLDEPGDVVVNATERIHH